MADPNTTDSTPAPPANQSRTTKDEVALDLMKFIAVTTGYGKGQTGTGFGAKGARTTEEHVDSLLQLFERCRDIVGK